MNIKYREEHFTCDSYEREGKNTMQTLLLKKGERYEREVAEAEIAFIRKGSLIVSYQKTSNQKIRNNQMTLLPPASSVFAQIEEDTSLLLMKLDSSMKLCNTYAMENLFKEKFEKQEEGMLLYCNDRVNRYLDLLIDCINDGIRCKHYLEIKLKELLFYFRLYYTKEDLYKFFSPILNSDSAFATFVYKNYKQVKTVQQLSSLYGYSQSSFEKQFKKVFGVPAYQWMVNQKATQIYHKLSCSSKSFVEIADEYDFSSSSQFCDFCKHFLGASPKEIRRKGKKCRTGLGACVTSVIVEQ